MERRLSPSEQKDALVLLRVLLLKGCVVQRRKDPDTGETLLREPKLLFTNDVVGNLGDGRKLHRMIERGLLSVLWSGDWGQVTLGPRAVAWIEDRTSCPLLMPEDLPPPTSPTPLFRR